MRTAQSAPSFKETLHHRGEGMTGTVRGFEGSGEALYVPKASWTESVGSPMKHQLNFDAEKFCADSRVNEQQRDLLKHHVRSHLDRQLQDKTFAKKSVEEEKKELLLAANTDVARKLREDSLEKVGLRNVNKAFREGLDEQAAENAKKVQEHRMWEAYDAAEIKLRTTQQLCQELMEASRRKEAQKRDYAETLKELESRKLLQRADRNMELQEVRRTMREQMGQEEFRLLAQQERIKAAAEHQEVNYRHFAETAARVEPEKRAREERRVERDEKHHMMRTDMYYAQRELARERQQQRVKQVLDDQVEANARKHATVQVQLDHERQAVNDSTRISMEAELAKSSRKRAEEMEHQAALVAQMHESQQRKKGEEGHHRRAPALKIMDVTPGLLSIAESWRSGASPKPSDADLTQRMDAARHLSKPCGRPEEKPWVDITKSHGIGGVVGIFGGDGPTRSKLMASGGPGRLLAKSSDLAARDKQWAGNWYDSLSPADIKAGQQVAAKRREAAVADKAVCA